MNLMQKSLSGHTVKLREKKRDSSSSFGTSAALSSASLPLRRLSGVLKETGNVTRTLAADQVLSPT